MHAVILAAGLGERMGSPLARRPKALLPLGRGCLIDKVVTAVWVPGITAIHVVHNDLIMEWEEPRPKNQGFGMQRHQLSWPREFKRWRKASRWSDEPGKNKGAPYIKLHNDGVHWPKDRLGILGDLWHVLKGMDFKKVHPGRSSRVPFCATS